MKMRGMLLFGWLLLAVSLAGCSRSDAANAPTTPFLQCQEPRPEICYEVFAPVCATINDPAIRCVTAPCPSSLRLTYVNDCKACANPRVQGFTLGECQ
jgi:hypothetical protein